MSEIILHHYASSTFSERVRLAFGLKNLAWRSVEIPGTMPKPDLLPLTGGYRRTPVLQIGADIFCDTQLILRKIEAISPEPTLYPGGVGLVSALAWWIDRSIFPPALGAVALARGASIPPDFVAERKAFGFALAPEDVEPFRHRHLQQGAAHLAWISDMLADGRRFLLGEHASLADFAAHGPLWLLRHQGGAEAETLLPLPPLRDWYERVDAIGHGRPADMSATDALTVAAASRPARPEIGDDDPSGLRSGTKVIVRADDTGRDPVIGTLVAADAWEIVIHVEGSGGTRLHLHFPRAGFDVTPATSPLL